ncbi:calnexin isoform X1 [Hermetia illucens]|uniref:calnexin isoform X1 n=1 Tax=Hermetia illucens TaxID=343691 RepID=UPI0018CC3A38|nr:calnexin isoform X1 [Hermetia illucens]XP_037909616.1 calnexin isoform X1 [Hermetia illucens]XP_037909626.1 calnexin isoform X1 [Hermetia illucens]
MRWKFVLVLLFGLALIATVRAEEEADGDDGAEVDDGDDSDDYDSDVEEEDPAAEEAIQNYQSPEANPQTFYFAEHFDDLDRFGKAWIKSQAKKDDIAEEIAKYDGEWAIEAPAKQILKNDFGLVLKSKAKHAAIASRLSKPFDFRDPNKALVVQYEVTMQDGQDCGGSYIKLLSTGKETADLTKFHDKTPYTIMFGPDKCGNDVKLHFIFRYTNPINGSVTEKHCRKAKERLEEPFKDKNPHLYQLYLQPNGQYRIQVDEKTINEGTLLNDFTPPVNPPREIDDPSDLKPENWDEREKIPDPDSKKPDDWDEDAPPQIPDPNAAKPGGWLDDEEEMIPDPNAKKPEDWDSDMDGEWEAPLIENPVCEKAPGCGPWKAPLISNPNYKGKWRAPLIDNPNYQGKWAPRKIPNPDFFEDLEPYKKLTSISAVGIEIWSMSNNILFDNIIITDNLEDADAWAKATYSLKRHQINKDSKTIWHRMMRHMGYKPGWWAVYFIYCAIPIAIYARILVKFAKEGKDPQADSAARAKKTDEPTADDDEPRNGEKGEKNQPHKNAAGGDAETHQQKPSPKSKKSDLEVDDDIETLQDNNVDDEEEGGEDEIVIEDNSAEEAVPEHTEGVKKRRPRKE